MAVVDIILKPESIASSDSRQNGVMVRSYSRTYKVVTDGPATTSTTVKNAAVPFGAAHPEDATAYCYKRDARIVNNCERPIWEVACEWTSDPAKHGAVSPLYPYTPAKINGAWDTKEIPVNKDLDGLPIVNTAKELFNPPHTEPIGIPTRTINVNLTSDYYSDSWDEQFFNAVNDSTYYSKPAGTVIVKSIAFTDEVYTDDDGNETPYRAYSIEVAYNKDGWQPRLLSMGYRDINGNHIREPAPSLRPVGSPVPLDAAGMGLFGDDVDDAHVLDYTTKEEVSFADITF